MKSNTELNVIVGPYLIFFSDQIIINRHDWARSMLADASTVSFPGLLSPWSDIPPTYCDKLGVTMASQRKHLQQMKLQHTSAWTDSRKTYQQQLIEPSIAQTASLDKKRLKLHSLLKKAESALATQIRTGKIGLADFLHNRRVPGITSPGLPLRLAKANSRTCNQVL